MGGKGTVYILNGEVLHDVGIDGLMLPRPEIYQPSLASAAADGFYRPKGGPTPRCGPDGGFVFTGSKAWPARGSFLDEGLAIGIASLMASDNSTSLLDVGAGSGQYGAFYHARRASGLPAPMWSGVDGARGVAEYTRRFGPPGAQTAHVNLCDASAAARVGVHDWAVSLAVGEHVPSRCLSAFLHVLHVSNRHGVILSWDEVKGSGDGCHVSAKLQRQLVAAFDFLGGYQFDREATILLRGNSTISWLKRNLLVLRRNASHEAREPPSIEDQAFRDWYTNRAAARSARKRRYE